MRPRSSVVPESPVKLKKYSAAERDMPRELIALSPTCIRDCFPNLDVGDAFSITGTARLLPNSPGQDFDDLKDNGDSVNDATDSEVATAIRKEMVDVLSGHSVLMSIPDDGGEDNLSHKDGYAPWSLRYSGHQFGVWAGQLGDGRAISICEDTRLNRLLHDLDLEP